MSFTPTVVDGGKYKIINVGSGTVITLSDDGKSVAGFLDRNLETQMWTATRAHGDIWALRCFYHSGEHLVNAYLSYEGDKPADGERLIGALKEHFWQLTQNDTHRGAEYMIVAEKSPGRGFVADLEKGNQADATPISLWVNSIHNIGNQRWLFQKVPNEPEGM